MRSHSWLLRLSVLGCLGAVTWFLGSLSSHAFSSPLESEAEIRGRGAETVGEEASLLRSKARFAFYDERLKSEGPDVVRESTVRKELDASLSDSDHPVADSEVSCSASLCRVRLAYAAVADMRASIDAITLRPPFNTVGHVHVPDPDIASAVIYFSPSRDVPLPDDRRGPNRP
jgi:hypothetical protein